jgi:hypothetical protein
MSRLESFIRRLDAQRLCLDWAAGDPAAGAAFFSAEHRPRTYRGGLAADLQRLLPMGPDGGFKPGTAR